MPKFDNSSPSVILDKEIMSLCHQYRLRRSTQWNPFNDYYLLSKFYVPSFSVIEILILEIYRFSNWSFFWLWAVQSWHSFYQLWAHQIDPICSLVLTLDRPQLFYWVWVRHAAKNNPIKIQETRIGSLTQVIFNDSINRNQELVSAVNKIVFKGSVFNFSLNTFFWFLR